MIKLDKIKKEILKKNLTKPKRIFNILRAYFNFYLKKERLGSSPVFIDIEPTIFCNLKCRMCHVPIWNRKHPNLSFSDFKKIIAQFPNIVLVKIQGMGEPLFNKDLFRMIRYAKHKGIITRTTSNATILNKKNSRGLVKSGLNEIIFSIDGAKKKTFEGIRVGANFEKVVRNVSEFVKIKNRLNGKKGFPQITVWNVISKKNVNEILDMVKLVKKTGADQLTLQMTLNSYGNEDLKKSYRDKNLIENNYKNKNLIKKTKELAKKEKLKLNIFYEDRYSKKNVCKNPWLTAYVSVDKFLTPCCIRPDPRKFSMGDLKKDNFSKIWNNKKYRILRRTLAKNKLLPMCIECYKK